MKILLVGNGEIYNRGCEAITLTTIKILRSIWPDSVIKVFSFNVDADKSYECDFKQVEVLPMLVPDDMNLYIRVLRKLGIVKYVPKTLREQFEIYIRELKNADLVLSLGGDNYSDDYGLPVMFWELGFLAKEMQVPFVVWGASIGPFKRLESIDLSKRGLEAVSLVTARENATVDYLSSIGYAGKVTRVYDSAFLLEKKSVKLPEFKRPAELVGFNISPIYHKYAKISQEDVLEISSSFIADISVKYNVLLIPHVNFPKKNNNDFDFMSNIQRNDNVKILPPNLDCRELKFAISKCAYFIGSRTHATIAGFSQFVPTLSLAYSLKAHGLNHDLFATDQYLLDACDFSVNNLKTKFELLRANRSVCIEVLRQKAHISSAMISAGLNALQQLVHEKTH